jgi:hypothetical protein
MQSSSRALPFKQNLAGASPATDANSILDFRFAIFDFPNPKSAIANRKSTLLSRCN